MRRHPANSRIDRAGRIAADFAARHRAIRRRAAAGRWRQAAERVLPRAAAARPANREAVADSARAAPAAFRTVAPAVPLPDLASVPVREPFPCSSARRVRGYCRARTAADWPAPWLAPAI